MQGGLLTTGLPGSLPKSSSQMVVFLDEIHDIPCIPRDSPSHPKVNQLLLSCLCLWISQMPVNADWGSSNPLGHFSKAPDLPQKTFPWSCADHSGFLKDMFKRPLNSQYDLGNVTLQNCYISIVFIQNSFEDQQWFQRFGFLSSDFNSLILAELLQKTL